MYRVCLGWKPSKTVYTERFVKGNLTLLNKSSGIRCVFSCADAIPFGGEENLMDIINSNHSNPDGGCFGFVKKICVSAHSSETVILKVGEVNGKADRKISHISALQINTENRFLNELFNTYLYKQVTGCRFYARTSFYQCGGAYGFRDQLQDCLAILYTQPEVVLRHILLCASHQYEEGDVMHWWHPPAVGVRTHNSDDRLFLCYVTARYIDRTGDKGILNRRLPFLHSKPLDKNEVSRYEQPSVKRFSETLLEHIKRALFGAMKFGSHDLLLVGGSDWNDGLDKIGREGYGESVWLSMFAYMTAVACSDYFEGSDKGALVAAMSRLKNGINASFRGDRFPAYYCDDGELLGVNAGKACTLYSLTQAFSALCGAVEPLVTNVALDTALKLVDDSEGIVKIFLKPFSQGQSYGYICDYPQGVRENGGQYTHAAIWLARAFFEVGRADEGYLLLRKLNPVECCTDKATAEIYCGEPYVLSADVYSGEYAGRAGWSWYTGAASWYYVTVAEGMFGLRFAGGQMYFTPHLPSEMQKAVMRISLDGTEYVVSVRKAEKNEIFINGKLQGSRYITPIPNKGRVFLEIRYCAEKSF